MCVLNRYSSHNYIHLIEDYDYKVFLQISKEIMIQVKNGKIDMEQLKNIDELLQFFEYKFRNEPSRNGDILIKPEYKKRILIK